MADSAYLLIAGNGATSKTNIEALLSDYLVMLKQQKQTPVMALVYDDYPSTGLQEAAKLAKEKNIQILAYLRDEDKAVGLPAGTSFQVEREPYKEAAKLAKGSSDKAYGFLLWDDEDPHCVDALATFSAKGIPCFDLTKGLTDINPVKGLKAPKEPKMPDIEVEVEEVLDERSQELLEASEDDSEVSEEYTDEEEVLMEYLYDSMLGFAKVMAQLIAIELKKDSE